MTQRTGQQRKGIEVGCKLLAKTLNDAGLDQRTILKPSVSIPWTQSAAKEQLFKPVMNALFGKESTTELEKIGEIEVVWDVLLRHLGEKFGIEYIEFPVDKKKQKEKLSGYKTNAGKTSKGLEYPEYTGAPKI